MKYYKKIAKMIKNICKSFLCKKNTLKVSTKTLSYFSTKLAPLKDRLEDWQYVQQISKQIKENDINSALSYLIQSHLSNLILNKQIYYSLHQKMSQSYMASGYHEILYKLYREHFQPNQMTLGWMKTISRTENLQLSKMLKKDFQKLNQAFPVNIQSQKQSKQTVRKVDSQSVSEQQAKPQSLGRKSRKVPKISSTDEYFSSSPQTILIKRAEAEGNNRLKTEKMSEKGPAIQIMKQAYSQKFEQIIELLLKEYGKVTLHNVELEIDSEDYQSNNIDDEMNQMYNQDQATEHEHQEEEGDSHNQQEELKEMMVDTLCMIKKIKIGKIQFHNSHTLQSIKNLNTDDLHKDPKTQP